MNRIVTSCIVLAIAAQTATAGGILTNTNTNIAFNRNMARDGVIAIDGVYSNPAGVSFMPQGWHLSLNNQSAFQTRDINSGIRVDLPAAFAGSMTEQQWQATPFYQPFRMNGGDENGMKKFEGKAAAPILPSVQVALVKDKWTLQGSFALVGGGGKCTFNHGLGSFERQVSLLPAILTGIDAKYRQFPELQASGLGLGTTTPGYSVESYMHGQQYVFGLQLGASYKLSEHWAVYGGFRFNYVYNKYEGNIRNISVNINGQNENLAAYITNNSAELAQVATMLGGRAQTLAGQAEQAAAAAAALQSTDPATAAQYAAAAQQAAGAAAKYVEGAQGIQGMAGMTGLISDKYLDCTQTGWAICPIIGADFRYNKLNIGWRLEFTTHFNIQNNTKVDDTGLFADGVNTPGDMPGITTLGVQYEILPTLRVMGGLHYFFDKDARMDKGKQSKLSHNTWEWNAGVEYDVTKDILVSCGMQKTNYGLGDGSFLNDMSFVTSSYSLGFGASFRVASNMKLNLAYFQTFYDTFNKEYEESYTMAGQTITAKCRDEFTRTNKVFGVGLDIDF